MAVLTGLEPAAFALTGRRANQTALQDREGDDSDAARAHAVDFAEQIGSYGRVLDERSRSWFSEAQR